MENPFQTLITRIERLEFLLTCISDKLESVKAKENPLEEELGDIELASKVTGLAIPTIYTKVSKSEIPYMKRGKKLYFSKAELIQWIKMGKKKTLVEIRTEVDDLMGSLKRA